MPIVPWPEYTLNHRGDLVQAWKVTTPSGARDRSPLRFLQVCGPSGVARQLALCPDFDCQIVPMTDQWRAKFTHRLRAPDGVPPHVEGLLDLLSDDLVTLRPVVDLDFVVVLDWYKIVDDDIEPMYWKNTRAGELVHKMKYWTNSPGAQEAAGARLAELMAEAIGRHPVLDEIETIVTVPGSKADGNSSGERLAVTIAKATGKNVVATVAVNGPRASRKSGGVVSLEGEFQMPHTLSGSVLIVDDVVKRGESMRVVAKAARLAGAEVVAGFAAVKTMSG